MKRLMLLVLLLLSSHVAASSPSEQLNEGLLDIYQALASETGAAELVDKQFTVNLTLKFASEKYLLFHDAYIRINDTEQYQLAKWQFAPDIIKGVIGKAGVTCRVTFKVIEVYTASPYEAMPHILAELQAIAPNQ